MGPEWTAPAAIRGGVSPACISLSWQLQEGSHLWSLQCCSYSLSCEGPKAELGATGSTVTEELGRRPLLVSLLSAAGLRISPSSLGFLNLVNPDSAFSSHFNTTALGVTSHYSLSYLVNSNIITSMIMWLFALSQFKIASPTGAGILSVSIHHYIHNPRQRIWPHRWHFVWANICIDDWRMHK